MYIVNMKNKHMRNSSTQNSANNHFLSERERNNILNRFPDFELSYEKITHNKVSADIYVVIPKGRKYIIWLTYFNDKNVCILMEMTGRKLIFKSMEFVTLSFKDNLSNGTILYGTLLHYDKNVFLVENIHYYKGKNISNKIFSDKMVFLEKLFKNEIRQISFADKGIILGLPVIKKDFQEAADIAESLPYQTYCIQSRLINKQACFLNYIHEQTEKNVTFQVRADVQNDIYNLYYYKNGNYELYDIAQIQNYKMSVYMNGLFRRIRENENLDYLEESEDEEDFENVSDDKFVNLDKRVNMVCSFNKNFNKWMPERVVSLKDKIITFEELRMIQNKQNSYKDNGVNSNNYKNKKNNVGYYKGKNNYRNNYGNRYTNNYSNTYKRDYYRK